MQLALLLLFDEPKRRDYYQWCLLYHDFRDGNCDEVAFYVEKVLWLRRLQLANNVEENPSNAHH